MTHDNTQRHMPMYASHDLMLQHDGWLQWIVGLSGVGLSLSLSVVNSRRNLNVAKIGSLMEAQPIIKSSALSICQFVNSPVPDDSVHCYFVLRVLTLALLAWLFVKGINTVLLWVIAARFGVALMHFDCIFMWQECKIKDEWITQHIQTNKQIWKNE